MARDLSPDEIEAARAAHGDALGPLARAPEVSEPGLRQHMKALGLL